jgi:hypothetical protein
MVRLLPESACVSTSFTKRTPSRHRFPENSVACDRVAPSLRAMRSIYVGVSQGRDAAQRARTQRFKAVGRLLHSYKFSEKYKNILRFADKLSMSRISCQKVAYVTSEFDASCALRQFLALRAVSSLEVRSHPDPVGRCHSPVRACAQQLRSASEADTGRHTKKSEQAFGRGGLNGVYQWCFVHELRPRPGSEAAHRIPNFGTAPAHPKNIARCQHAGDTRRATDSRCSASC